MNCSDYTIVEVDELPDGRQWTLVDEPGEITLAIVTGSLDAQVMADCLAAYRRVMRIRETGVAPARRWLRAV